MKNYEITASYIQSLTQTYIRTINLKVNDEVKEKLDEVWLKYFKNIEIDKDQNHINHSIKLLDKMKINREELHSDLIKIYGKNSYQLFLSGIYVLSQSEDNI